ncbi:hypothetical protein ACJMK2_014713 [Sinanodonta woodiana]|uniref:Uncharacterized protein n=1 Tax=Sinanodonta woodiana TaxID=1069815 RepID=A0ABD3V2R4_SINWO
MIVKSNLNFRIVYNKFPCFKRRAKVLNEGGILHDTCDLNGTWINDLDSFIDVSCENGFLFGVYRIPVSNGEDVYELLGNYIVAGKDGKDRIVAFMVSWNNSSCSGNSNSITSYSGVYYSSEGIIYMHSLLTGYMEWTKRWETNLIGHVIFRRV